MDVEKKKRAQSCITVALFCVFLFGFAIVTIAKPVSNYSETENRMLKQMPELKMETVLSGDFEADYEEYLSDQFVFRNQWIGMKTLAERLLFKRESKDIYFADDGYLIEKHTGVFDSEMAKENRMALAQFSEKYSREFNTGHMTVMIVPNAVDILSDKLPPFAPSCQEGDYLEQIAARLPEEVWLDAASVLRQHKEENLYYKTDHHWKTIAAFYVYREWANKRGYGIPELDDYEVKTATDSFEGTIQSKLGIRTPEDTIELFLPKEEIAYTVSRDNAEKANTLYDESALNTKDKYAVYFGGNQSFLQIETGAGMGRRILVIKDSYANCFIPFMLGEFDVIDVLDLRYSKQRLSELIAGGEYTDLLVLYNASGFAEDMSISKILK